MSSLPDYIEYISPIHQVPNIELAGVQIINRPIDVPDDHIAYNPSGIWTIPEGQPGAGKDVVYLRVEPNRSDSATSHLGKTAARPYTIDLDAGRPCLEPFAGAMTIPGEDPSLTRINRRTTRGNIEKIWLLSVVDAQPHQDRPDVVKSLRTRIFAGVTLDALEQVAEGPEGMKDIRIFQASDPRYSTQLHVYGRPQPRSYSGLVTYAPVSGIERLNEQVIDQAEVIDEELYPVGSNTWGGVNDGFQLTPYSNILAMHDAHLTGINGNGRHYEAVARVHNFIDGTIHDIGVIATSRDFRSSAEPEQIVVKDDDAVDLSDVVFTGGGYNGSFRYMTAGVCDGNFGLMTLNEHVPTR
jgi:hypothetical protein